MKSILFLVVLLNVTPLSAQKISSYDFQHPCADTGTYNGILVEVFGGHLLGEYKSFGPFFGVDAASSFYFAETLTCLDSILADAHRASIGNHRYAISFHRQATDCIESLKFPTFRARVPFGWKGYPRKYHSPNKYLFHFNIYGQLSKIKLNLYFQVLRISFSYYKFTTITKRFLNNGKYYSDPSDPYDKIFTFYRIYKVNSIEAINTSSIKKCR